MDRNLNPEAENRKLNEVALELAAELQQYDAKEVERILGKVKDILGTIR